MKCSMADYCISGVRVLHRLRYSIRRSSNIGLVNYCDFGISRISISAYGPHEVVHRHSVVSPQRLDLETLYTNFTPKFRDPTRPTVLRTESKTSEYKLCRFFRPEYYPASEKVVSTRRAQPSALPSQSCPLPQPHKKSSRLTGSQSHGETSALRMYLLFPSTRVCTVL
jgi:hypothetical protein